jgi:hypothetical protein
MELENDIDQADAALQALLMGMAQQTNDPRRRAKLLAFAMTAPSMADWPQDSLNALGDTCEYVMSLARLGRELRQLTGGTDGDRPAP